MRNRTTTIFASLLMAVACAAYAQGEAGKLAAGASGKGLVDGMAASVNGESITVRDVFMGIPDQLRILARDKAMRAKGEDEMFKAAYDASLNESIDRKLILQAYWEGEQRVPEPMLDKARNEILETRYGGDLAALQSDLADSRMTYKDWAKLIEEQTIVRSMRHTYVGSNIHISPNEIATAYANRGSGLVVPEKIRVLAIALADDDAFPQLYSNILAKVSSANDFGKMAEDVSVDAMAEAGGDYGWIEPAEVLAPALADAASALADGDMSKPIDLAGKKYIIYRAGTQQGRKLTMREAQADIERELYNKEAERIYKAWMGRLRSGARISTHEYF